MVGKTFQQQKDRWMKKEINWKYPEPRTNHRTEAIIFYGQGYYESLITDHINFLYFFQLFQLAVCSLSLFRAESVPSNNPFHLSLNICTFIFTTSYKSFIFMFPLFLSPETEIFVVDSFQELFKLQNSSASIRMIIDGKGDKDCRHDSSQVHLYPPETEILGNEFQVEGRREKVRWKLSFPNELYFLDTSSHFSFHIPKLCIPNQRS